jgi:hypothetical protein
MKGATISLERNQAKLQPERFLSRFDRQAPTAVPAAPDKPVEEPPARILYRELHERIVADLGERAAGLFPMLDELKQHVEALFPPDPSLAEDEKKQGEHKARVEALCATIEDVLYAMSLSPR